MSFHYTYQNWKEGTLLWNGIDSNWNRNDYISKNCILQINTEQDEIFNREAKLITERLLNTYLVEKRTDTNRETTLKNIYKTVENLLYGDVDSFTDTTLLFESHGNGIYELSDEIDRKLIPPMEWDDFDFIQIQSIQKAFKFYKNNSSKWNYKTVQTPVIKDLNKHVDYFGEVNAKAYLDYSNRLRRRNGLIYNSFNTSISEHKLSKIRSGLKKGRFIDKESDSIFFEKVFLKNYIFQDERINWIGSKQALRHFVIHIEATFSESDKRSKWNTLQNCFVINGEEINPDSIRKSKSTIKSADRVELMIQMLKNSGF